MHSEGGIEVNNGQYIFENGQNVRLFCTLSEAGLNEGLNITNLRFETPSGDLVKPNSAPNNAAVSFIIANASVIDSGRYYCGSISNKSFSKLYSIALETGCKMHFFHHLFYYLSNKVRWYDSSSARAEIMALLVEPIGASPLQLVITREPHLDELLFLLPDRRVSVSHMDFPTMEF